MSNNASHQIDTLYTDRRMSFIATFGEISKTDNQQAGGKGASLGELVQAGIPVPDGFVILSAAFDQFIAGTGLDTEIDAALDSVDPAAMHTVENASEKIQALIVASSMPIDIEQTIKKSFDALGATYVAVRSSATAEDGATAAWAGQLESYLNTTDEHLIENVQKCWASLFSPRAIYYRFEKKMHKDKIAVAVVVQTMVESEVSGIAFSVHPVTQDYNQLIIEAGFGLGEAIVSGSITPDSFVVRKDTQEIIDQQVHLQERGLYRAKNGGNEWRDLPKEEGAKPTLSEAELSKLTQLIIKIESHYGFPVDIEWAKVGAKFFILQSRPITTLKPNVTDTPEGVLIQGEQWQLAVTRNMSFWHQCLMAQGWYKNSRDFGVDFELRQLSLTTGGTHTNSFTVPTAYARYLQALKTVFATPATVNLLKAKYKQYGDELLLAVHHCVDSLAPSTLTHFFDLYQRYTAGLQITAGYSKYATDKLILALEKLGYGHNEIPSIISTITYPEEHTPLFDSQLALVAIAHKLQEKSVNNEQETKLLHHWLQTYGNIPVNYCEEPWTIDSAKSQLRTHMQKNAAKELERLTKTHSSNTEKAKTLLQKINNADVPQLAYALAEGTYLNEYRKNIFSKVSLAYRPIFTQIAAICGSSNWRDCFFLTPHEMLEALEGKKIPAIAQFKEDRHLAAVTVDKDGKAKILSQADAKKISAYVKSLHKNTMSKQSDHSVVVKGFSASAGIVTGIVRIVLDAKDFHKMQSGDILVAPMTSVDFVPVMEKAAAFITNEGGIMCHASIVAREMGKPCIIATKNATSILQDGDFVEVDANKGIVTKI